MKTAYYKGQLLITMLKKLASATVAGHKLWILAQKSGSTDFAEEAPASSAIGVGTVRLSDKTCSKE